MFLKISNDIGNSETKMIISDQVFKQPSVYKRILNTPNLTENDIDKAVTNLQDEMLVNLTSKALKRNGQFFVGNRANQMADQVENMNINLGNKYKHDVPIVTTLSMIAEWAVQNSYKDTEQLPSTLDIKSVMTSAIPASEYTTDKAQTLERRFTDNNHIVVISVADQFVTVTINFDQVKVTQEGIPALYALLESDKDILRYYNKEYKKDSKPTDFQNKKILHVDIGDGTTEYIYTIGLNAKFDACSGERRGVGHATEEAIKMLNESTDGYVKLNRQQFMQAMRDNTHRQHEKANQFMLEARFIQADKILEDVQEKYMNNAASDVDVIVVYGGGSIQFKEELYNELLDFCNTVGCELLWIPKEYAVDMNVKGMNVLNDKVLFQDVTGG